MSDSKFHQLCGAYDIAQSNFETYKQNCQNFTIELVKELKMYYDIPDPQFTLHKITDKGSFDLIHGSAIGALTLTKDAFWHFGVGLTVCRAPNTFPEELILLQIIFRKEEGNIYYLKHTFGDKEFKVEKGNVESYKDYFEDLFQTILASYGSHIQQFIGHKTTRKLGYVQ